MKIGPETEISADRHRTTGLEGRARQSKEAWTRIVRDPSQELEQLFVRTVCEDERRYQAAGMFNPKRTGLLTVRPAKGWDWLRRITL